MSRARARRKVERVTTRMRSYALAAAVLLGVVGCAGTGSDKSGARDKSPVVLTMANEFGGTDELGPFLGAVHNLSHGTIRIEVRNRWRLGQTRFENGLIQDVRRGTVDLGWTGSRAWDSVGVKSLRALHAPFLIDGFALQERVARSPIAREMMAGLEPLGLVGLGVLPGP